MTSVPRQDCLPPYPSCMFVYTSVVCLCLLNRFPVFLSLPSCLLVPLFVCIPVYLFVCLHVCMPSCLPYHLFGCLFAQLSTSTSVCLSDLLFVLLSVHCIRIRWVRPTCCSLSFSSNKMVSVVFNCC